MRAPDAAITLWGGLGPLLIPRSSDRVKNTRVGADLFEVSSAVTAGESAGGRLDLEVQRSIEQRRARRLSQLARGERLSLAVSDCLLVAVGIAMAMLIPSARTPSVWAVLLLIGTY